MPRDAVSRTANVERTGRHKWVKLLYQPCGIVLPGIEHDIEAYVNQPARSLYLVNRFQIASVLSVSLTVLIVIEGIVGYFISVINMKKFDNKLQLTLFLNQYIVGFQRKHIVDTLRSVYFPSFSLAPQSVTVGKHAPMQL